MPIEADVTQLLGAWKAGDEGAKDKLMPLLYDELRRLAQSYVRQERAAQTVQPTMLVHEAYMRLVQQTLPDWQSRSHFFGVAAYLMRQWLVENARRHSAGKRGGDLAKVPLNEAISFAPERSSAVIDLDEAMRALAEIDERKCQIIELRFFGGMTIEEVARTLGLSTATVSREQRLAEAWLHREMRSSQE